MPVPPNLVQKKKNPLAGRTPPGGGSLSQSVQNAIQRRMSKGGTQ